MNKAQRLASAGKVNAAGQKITEIEIMAGQRPETPLVDIKKDKMEISQDGLIDKIKAGDTEAFQQLITLYRGQAFALSYSIVGNVEDAKDILQEALIKAYKNIQRFAQKSSFYTWFYAILVNTARDYLRQKKTTQINLLREEFRDSSAGAEKLVLNKELKQLLDEAIRQLPQKQRLSFIMKHINGMKIEEIAQSLNTHPGTVKTHLFRAVRALQQKLTPYLAAE